MSLYRNIEEFMKPPEEKAVFFFSWMQVFLILGGILVGSILGSIIQMSPSGNLIVTIICGGTGFALGATRFENVPLYQIIVSLVRYLVQLLSNRQAMVVRAGDLWPQTTALPGAGISIVGPQGPLFQVGEEDGKGSSSNPE